MHIILYFIMSNTKLSYIIYHTKYNILYTVCQTQYTKKLLIIYCIQNAIHNTSYTIYYIKYIVHHTSYAVFANYLTLAYKAICSEYLR